jgi:hypothetical protein
MSSKPTEIEAAKADSTSELMLEIERYLAAVALFRRLGCQPMWRSE